MSVGKEGDRPSSGKESVVDVTGSQGATATYVQIVETTSLFTERTLSKLVTITGTVCVFQSVRGVVREANTENASVMMGFSSPKWIASALNVVLTTTKMPPRIHSIGEEGI